VNEQTITITDVDVDDATRGEIEDELLNADAGKSKVSKND